MALNITVSLLIHNFQAKKLRKYTAQVTSEFEKIPEPSIAQFCDSVGTRLPHNRRMVLIYDMEGESDMAKDVFYLDLNSKIYHLQGS